MKDTVPPPPPNAFAEIARLLSLSEGFAPKSMNSNTAPKLHHDYVSLLLTALSIGLGTGEAALLWRNAHPQPIAVIQSQPKPIAVTGQVQLIFMDDQTLRWNLPK